MSFQFTIKKCLISVDGKKYKKNEISIGNRYMFIHYGKPGKYTGRIMINMEKPSEQVSKIEYNDTNHLLKFKWCGLWEDEDTGKESKKTLDFKIEFERSVDGERVYFALIKKLPLKKGRHTRRNPVRTKRGGYKKYSELKQSKGLEERIKKRKQKMKTKNMEFKKIIKNIPDEKILQLAIGKPLIRSSAPKSEIIREAKRLPRAYFTKEELLRHAKGGGQNKKSKKKGRKGPEESATKYPVGTEKKGNDGNIWVINVSKKGIQRWVKKEDNLTYTQAKKMMLPAPHLPRPRDSKSARGKNKPLEKLWTDMSNMKKLVFIMKDGSHQIKTSKQDEDQIDKGNNDPNVKVILTAGNSFDGYQQLYDRVKQSSVSDVLKNYKKYWKYKMDDKLYTC